MSDNLDKSALEAGWEDREERIYPALFGNLGTGIFPLTRDVFEPFGQGDNIDPGWLFCGVFESPPSTSRTSWLYVTSGLSNDWEGDLPDPNSTSGFGVELIFQCPEKSSWALFHVRRILAFQILLGCGRYPGRGMLAPNDRVPLRGPMDGKQSILRNLLVTPPTGFAGKHKTASGQFEFLGLVGISDEESAFARARSSQELFTILLANTAAPVTDPNRSNLVSN